MAGNAWCGNWNYPTSIRFGPGRVAEVPAACRELGIARPLVVTDPGLAGLPPVARVREALEGGGLPVTLYAGVHPDPLPADVSGGVAAFREAGCDGVVAVGGGSALDAGKAIALMVGQRGELWDYEDVGDNWTRVDVDGMAPVVAVPTTAGTGSEVGRCSVILDPDGGTKRLVFHPRMLPERVVADPELTFGLPPRLTAATGMDALSHALEAWCAPGFHPLADGIAAEAIRLVHRHLVRAYREPEDLAARSGMLAASLMGATAFQKGLGAMHALSHPIGARHRTHHGLTNAVVMPYVLAFNAPAIEERLERLGRYLGLPTGGPAGVVEWVVELRSALDIPPTLADLGLAESDLPDLVEPALADPSGATNPVPLDARAVETLLRRAWAGTLS